jgi:hypothetical protein
MPVRNARYTTPAVFRFGQTLPAPLNAKFFAVYLVFMNPGSHGCCMDPKIIALLIVCCAAISVSGCMTKSAAPAGITPLPTTLLPATPAATASPVYLTECTRAEDCVPAECCHPSRCIPNTKKEPCNLMCTASCEGPIDCGAGSCGCVNGTCSVLSSLPVPVTSAGFTAINLRVSPQRYSPIMSSTPGIGLEPVITGFGAQDATFAWKATYGEFLSWNPPDFKVNQLGDTATNHGEKIYWSFIDKPSSTAVPVTVTVIATDTLSGRTLGRSTVTLVWDGNYTVMVQEIR